MALSPYTIDVGPCRPDGTREIFLQHHQRPCFSTTHREVLRVCLVKWPLKPSVEEAARTADLDEMEAIRAQRAEEAYQTLLAADNLAEDGFPNNNIASDELKCTASAKANGKHATELAGQEGNPVLEDYLCVFHREELADQYGRYTFVQPQTICTAYRVKDTTALEFVLHTISPRDIAVCAVGSGGVFIHGRRQTTKGVGGWSSPLEYQGLQYKPASDAWWMSSPLSLKPIYVAVGAVDSPNGVAARTEATSVKNNPSASPPDKSAVCPEREGASVAEEFVIASPFRVGDKLQKPSSTCSSPRQGSPLTEAFAAPVEGRTAQGQFDFSHPRSDTPEPHSLIASSSRSMEQTAAAQDGLSSLSYRVQQPALHSSTNPRSKFISLDATVLTQLPLDEPLNNHTSQRSLAVVRTAPNELGLALLTPLYAVDAMLWQWWPHRVRFSKLASNASALSVITSPHMGFSNQQQQQRQQLLFLYDSHCSRLRVLRTPDLCTGEGDLELLFTFPCGDFPFVFPCLHTITHPAPIAVCNYPRANWISVYDVAELLEEPSVDTVALQLDLGAHQAVHTQRFGEVRLLGETRHENIYADTKIGAANVETYGFDAVLKASWTQKEQNAKVWGTAGDGTNSAAAHPIRCLLYHCDACLVLQYDWPSGAPQPANAECARGSTKTSSIASSTRNYQSTPETIRDRRRRRCEGTVSYTLHFPHLSREDQPLLVLILEALSAAIGPRATAAIEYELFHDAWRCSCSGVVDACADPFQACARLLKKLCGYRLPGSSTTSTSIAEIETITSATKDIQRAEGLTDPCVFVDPSLLTLQRVEAALIPWKRRLMTSSVRADKKPAATTTSLSLSWTPQQSGLALVALHLLFEACRLQEPLWTLLPPLAELNYSLCVQMQWPSYIEYYSAMVLSPLSAINDDCSEVRKTNDFVQCLPQSILDEVFDYLEPNTNQSRAAAAAVEASTSHVAAFTTESKGGLSHFASGGVPDLFRILSMLAVGSNSPTTHITIYRSWPVLKRLPENHPIALANRLVLVYREVFGAPVSNQQIQHAASAGKSHPIACSADLQWWKCICIQLLQQDISAHLVHHVLNTGVAYPLLEALSKGREQAEATWPGTLLDLVGRRDRCPPSSVTAQLISAGRHVVEAAEENAVVRQIRVALADDDSVSVRPDFRKTWRDARLDVVQNLFNTVAPISLSGFEDRPEELTGALELLSSRARAMPLGRGMLTMCTQSFKVQDSIPIPPLNLNGRTNDGINIVNKSTDDLMWPLFHNGCAAGLRFLPLPPAFCVGTSDAHSGSGRGGGDDAPQSFYEDGRMAAAAAQTITKQWVMYQTKSIGNAASRAGLLLATGILGHLTVLQRTDIFYLLISRQEQYVWREATTMAVMLGLSCSFCGTGSEAVFRCLSVHVQSLNPSAEDIEVSLDVQTAALVSMGLLCQQQPSNAFLVEVFLVEISRLPTDEHCSKREGYVLGAGFGLGQLLLGVGATHGIPHVEDRLLAFMNGAPRKSAVSTREGVEYFEETMSRGEAGHFLARALLSQEQRGSSFNACASVYEGDCYNVFVSGPAAAVALGFMYLQTDSAFMAAKVAPPNRCSAVQQLTPLLCHLRSTMASLICWSGVAPTRAWLYAQLPSTLLDLTITTTTAAATTRVPGLAVQQRNYLLMNLAHCLAGHVMALGLRYAGTMDTQVRDVIYAELQGFVSGHIGSTKTPIPAVQRVTGAYHTCILTCACALSLVMAGTGDLKVFGALQHLHRRTNVPYGSHMAISMSLGLLFLGSGRLTLSNNIASVAALFMSFYPLWPSDPEDNTHHLQALRHLYGLAVVPRVMEAVDAISHQPVSVPVCIVLRPANANISDSNHRHAALKQRKIRTRTPCLFPPVEMIERVEVHDPQHYPLTFDARSTELTRWANMEFRVMAKDGACSHGGRHVSQSPLESRLFDWLHRLFHQPSTTTAEALTMMDSMTLMHHVQRRLVTTAMAGEMLLNADFSAAVKEAMEKRYGFIFLHRAGSTVPVMERVESAGAPPHHPLYQLIVQNRPYKHVLESIAAHPHGTAAFPCNFTSLISPPQNKGANDNRDTDRERSVSAEDEVEGKMDLRALHRWVTEALHYYCLRRYEQQQIREVLSTFLVHPTEQDVVNGSALFSSIPSSQRLSCLLKLQAATHLPFSTLERVWICCFD